MDQSLVTYYRHRASEYDEVYDKPERQSDIALVTELVRDFASSRRILEVAAGTGFWTEVAAETAKSIMATDFAEEPLAHARRRVYASPVAFHLCDAFSLETLPGTFDAGLACFWLSHLTRHDMSRFVTTFPARLEPGSRVLLVDNRYVEGSNWPVTRRDADGNSYQRRRLHNGEEFEVLKNFLDRRNCVQSARPSVWTSRLPSSRTTGCSR